MAEEEKFLTDGGGVFPADCTDGRRCRAFMIYALLAEGHRWAGVRRDRINAESQRTRSDAEGQKKIKNEDEMDYT
jgi:hypothetical protein